MRFEDSPPTAKTSSPPDQPTYSLQSTFEYVALILIQVEIGTAKGDSRKNYRTYSLVQNTVLHFKHKAKGATWLRVAPFALCLF